VKWIDEQFPAAVGRYRLTSERDGDYNCVAYAAGVTDEWWSHLPWFPWPAARSPLAESLVAVFAALGYEPCAIATIEPRFERVALYAKDNIWTHVAWQLPSGEWASKLGAAEDIEHDTPECLCGDLYGAVHCIMRRPVTTATVIPPAPTTPE
jgi:hypothetical protein